MTSNTIRGQAASAVLSLLSDEIYYAYFRYSKASGTQDLKVAKITKSQYQEIKRISDIKKQYNASVGSSLIIGDVTPLTIEGVSVYAVLDNLNDKANIPFQVIEIVKAVSYTELTVNVEPLELVYVRQILSDEANETEKMEAKAVSLATNQAMNRIKQNQAQALLGEDGLKELKNSLGLSNSDNTEKTIVNNDDQSI